jgi:hypothetical protein
VPEIAANFPHDPDKGVTSNLASARDGGLVVVVQDGSKGGSIRDLLSGKEVGTLPRWEGLEFRDGYDIGLFAGGWLQLVRDKERIEVRELPSGQLRGELELSESEFKARGPKRVPVFWCLTLDCNWVVRSAAETYISDVRTGKRRRLEMPAARMALLDRCVGISPDGNFLLLLVNHQREPNHPWLEWLLSWLGRLPQEGQEVVIYNLTTSAEVGSFRDALDPEQFWWLPRFVKFSLDGKSVAVLHGKGLDIYDFPLHRPWLRIATYALVASVIAWLLVSLLGRCFARRR